MSITFPNPGDLSGWAHFLSKGSLPMLASTHNALSSLKLKDDSLLPSELAVMILRDPLFTATIIKHLQINKNKLRIVDITTIEHAIMMLGIEPFYKNFGDTLTIDESFQTNPLVKNSIFKVARRSYVASRIAQDWAAKAKDIESEEIQVAALIHDVAEILLWMKAPAHAFLIKKLMQENPTMRSEDAQKKILGISLVNVEIEICTNWGMPDILLNLLKTRQHHNQRMAFVELSVKLSRHCATDWSNPARPDDWNDISNYITHTPVERTIEEHIPFIEGLMRKWDHHNRGETDIQNQSDPNETLTLPE
jgi:HD-like signal output (HDOD) protein